MKRQLRLIEIYQEYKHFITTLSTVYNHTSRPRLVHRHHPADRLEAAVKAVAAETVMGLEVTRARRDIKPSPAHSVLACAVTSSTLALVNLNLRLHRRSPFKYEMSKSLLTI